jgi:alkylhydroperoxidase family enzyme
MASFANSSLFVVTLMLMVILATLGAPVSLCDEPAASRARVPLLNDAEAWRRLPAAESGGGAPLPSWARALAGSLPHTTAAMLELDRTFRTSDAIDRKLAAAIRLAVARTLHSRYGQASAELDLRRACPDQPTFDRMIGERSNWPEADRAALVFAEHMTTAGSSVTDAEVAALVTAFGEAKVVAIVLQVAYSNFLYRMALALDLPVEPGGALQPLEVQFVKPPIDTVIGSEVPASARPAPPAPTHRLEPQATDPEWTRLDFSTLQQRLETQRTRAPRVSIPTWEEFRQALPATLYPRVKPLQIRWSLLVSGRQPKLGPAWIKCTRTFGSESKQDRVFEETLFWVVTRTLRCFYCMGHCEMLLEVAGLDKPAIAQRTAKLAGDDWSSFPLAEQDAFRFARKLTQAPSSIDDADIRNLIDDFGLERALDVVWWASRCQFMTKISDAFQLQLERENVFAEFMPTLEKPK